MSHKINNSREIKNTKTAEPRCTQAEQLQASITDGSTDSANSEKWTRFLQFVRSFLPYSLNNLILVISRRSGRP